MEHEPFPVLAFVAHHLEKPTDKTLGQFFCDSTSNDSASSFCELITNLRVTDAPSAPTDHYFIHQHH